MKRIVFFLIILLPFISFSQNEAAIWYFGQNAGLDFNSGVPVVLNNGQLNTLEGCATISDSSGNLLFYTDGVTIYDKSHNVMQNGTGLDGNSSSTQSAIIVPKPNNINLYYIFTVDANVNGASSGKGINYSIVDINLNGGLGAVTTKNNNLLPWAFEKITAVKHANNNSFWLITFRTNQFFAWEIDAAGINPPIISNVGINTNSSIGYLKASPNGSKIASANYGLNPSMMLYDFNNSNGIVSNETTLILDESDDVPYGVEFSPSNNYLYVLSDKLNGSGRILPSKLMQFDMQSANIANSGILIHTSNKYYRGALQLAIDGKIYRAQSLSAGLTQVGSNFLGVINNPNINGFGCNYVEDAFPINAGDPNRKVVEGLPPFVTSIFLEPNITANDVCLGNPTQFNFNSTSPPTTITWDFGDPSGTDDLTDPANPLHTFSSSGIFTVTATGTIGANPFNLTLDITIYDLPVVTSPVTLTKCDDNLDGIEDFDLNDAIPLISSESPLPTFTYFLTETDAIANTNPIADPTVFSNNTQATVWARIENATGCFVTAQIDLEVISIDIPNAFMLTYNQCDDLTDGDDTNGLTTFDFSNATNQVLNALLPVTDLTVAYYETIADATAEINAINPSNYTNTTATTQQIVVRVDKTTDTCFGLGFHITLNVTPVPIFNLNPSITLCLSSSNAIIGVENPVNNYDYLWTNSSGNTIGNTQQINVDTEDTYTVTATDTNGNNCQTSKNIQVIAAPILPLPNFGLNNLSIIDNTSNNSINVNTTNLPVSTYEFALDDGDYQTNNIFQTVSGGLHTVKIRDIDNCLEASVEISLISIPNFFTPNNDGTNDTWQVTGIENQPTSKIYVFDRFGKLIAILNPLGNGWNGLYKGNPLPSTDYWYKVELEDGRVFRGHFSLIRK